MHNKSVNPTVKRLRQRQVRKIMITPVQPCNFLGVSFLSSCSNHDDLAEANRFFYFLRKSRSLTYITISSDQSIAKKFLYQIIET